MSISPSLADIANTLIVLHRDCFGESPTPMKLQKLCYYAQGYALAEGTELFPEDFQAWQHGPVIPELYHKYKHLQWKQISDEIELPELNNIEFLRDITTAYGRYDGAALSTMTHREEPWLKARIGLGEMDGSTNLISKLSLQQYFQAQLAAYV
ncbi:MAG: Panacea domain-containing protein [Prochlorothrix sp.]